MNPNRTVLVVDDEPKTRNGLQRMLESWGSGSVRILTASDGEEAFRMIEQTSIDLLITDIRMPLISGLRLVDRIRESSDRPMPTVILISGYAEFEYAHKAIELGVANYLLKPIGKDKLIAAVEEAFARHEQKSRIGRLQKIADPRLLEAEHQPVPLSEPVQHAVRFIDENLHQPFGLKQVADTIHLNPSYLSVLFKDQLSMTFSEYVTRRRLQRAKELLLHTRMPVAEIAESVGYQTAKYFNRMFKEYEGHSPGQYRSAMLKDGD
jgi:two-component system, response regulator YesN